MAFSVFNFIDGLTKEKILNLFLITLLLLHASEWLVSSMAMVQMLERNGTNIVVAYIVSPLTMFGLTSIQCLIGLKLPSIVEDLWKDRKNIIFEIITILVLVSTYGLILKIVTAINLVMDNIISPTEILDVDFLLPEISLKEISNSSVVQPTETQYSLAVISTEIINLLPVVEILVGVLHVGVRLLSKRSIKETSTSVSKNDSKKDTKTPDKKTTTDPETKVKSSKKNNRQIAKI